MSAQTDSLLSVAIKETPSSFVRSILKAASDPEVISFAGGLPNPSTFPIEELKISMSRVMETYGAQALQYSETAGLLDLRDRISKRYNTRFNTDYSPSDVLITTGSQQALDLLGKVVLNEGDCVAVERPTYLAAVQSFSLRRPVFQQVELTENGADKDQFRKALDAGTKLVYLIPNFQNPTGLTYSEENRNEIRAIAKAYDVVLVEDDPYGELRFEGSSLPYIGASELPHSVIMGSFSKTVAPGMRLGFILSKDRPLIAALAKAKEATDLHSDVLSQYILSDYLENNDLDEHLYTTRTLYKEQADAMLEAIGEFFPETVSCTRPEGGMFCWATLPAHIDAMNVFEKAVEQSVAFVPSSPFFASDAATNSMRLNFTNADIPTIREGIERLGSVLTDFCS